MTIKSLWLAITLLLSSYTGSGQPFFKEYFFAPDEAYLASESSGANEIYVLTYSRSDAYFHYRLYRFSLHSQNIDKALIDSFHYNLKYNFGGFNLIDNQVYTLFNYTFSTSQSIVCVRRIDKGNSQTFFMTNGRSYIKGNGFYKLSDSTLILFGESYASLSAQNENLYLLAVNHRMQYDTNYFFGGQVEINFRAGTNPVNIWPTENKKHFDGGFLKGIYPLNDSLLMVYGAYENVANFESAALVVNLQGRVHTQFMHGHLGADYLTEQNDYYEKIYGYHKQYYFIHRDVKNEYLSILDSASGEWLTEFSTSCANCSSSLYRPTNDTIFFAGLENTQGNYFALKTTTQLNGSTLSSSTTSLSGKRPELYNAKIVPGSKYWLLYDFQMAGYTQTVLRFADLDYSNSVEEAVLQKHYQNENQVFDILGRSGVAPTTQSLFSKNGQLILKR
ncbi:hypothetical protein GC194_12770 [bacterium]|nr:hypothetical protein [bacterium]